MKKRIIAGLSALLLSLQTSEINMLIATAEDINSNTIELILNEVGTEIDLKVQVKTNDVSQIYNYNELSINSNSRKIVSVPSFDNCEIILIDGKNTEVTNDDSIICRINDLQEYSSSRDKYKLDGVYQSYEVIVNPSTNNSPTNIVLNTYVNGDVNLDGSLMTDDLLILKQKLLFEYNVIQTGAYEQNEDGGKLCVSGKSNDLANNLTINGDLYADNGILLKFNGGNINGHLSSNDSNSIELISSNGFSMSWSSQFYSSNLNKDILLTDDDINKLYFSNNTSLDNSTEITEQNLNINTNKAFPNDITFNASSCMNLNASIKADGDININGEVHNANNAIIYSKENITIENNSTFSFTGMIYAPNGTVTINANNVNITGCIIAKNVIINADTINFNVNSFTKYENENISKVLSELQLFLADMNNDGIIDDKDLSIMKRIILGLDPDETYVPYEKWNTLEDSDGDGVPDIFVMDNWSNLNDWDEDGIPDSVESYYGTNRYIKDTDNDVLTDYEELFYTYTDPLIFDSLVKGVSDGELDLDDDGLTNIQEIEYTKVYSTNLPEGNPYNKLDLLNPDTDNDGLSDYCEIFEYSTNPLLYDTDGDGVSDGKENLISTNPLVWDSDTMVNYNYNLDSDFGIVKSMSFTTSAYVCENLNVENLSGIDVLTENVVGAIGVPIKVIAPIDFNEKIKTNWLLNYTDICETLNMDTIDLNDIDVLYYNETEQQYEIVKKDITDTSDENLKSISFDTVNNGTYIAIYTPTWTSAWENAPNYAKDTNISIGYNTVLTIDCSGSMNGDMNGNRIKSVKSSAKSYIDKNIKENDNTAIVSFTDTASVEMNFSTNKNNLKDTIDGLQVNGGTNIYAGLRKSIDILDKVYNNGNKNIIILLSDGEDDSNLNDLLSEAKNKGIIIYTIALDSNTDKEKLNNIATKTGGCLIGINTSNGVVNDMYEPIEYMKGIDTITDNDEDGLPDYYEQTGIQLINGQFIPRNELKTCSENSTELNKKSSADTDNDGLLDGEEIQAKYLSEYILSNDITQPNANKLTFVMKSDPRKVDSDGDGLNDYDEVNQYTTNPNKSDINKLSLKNDFFSINYKYKEGIEKNWADLKNDGNIQSYGGYQGWFGSYGYLGENNIFCNGTANGRSIHSKGCGIIAMADMFMYLALSDSKYNPIYNSNPFYDNIDLGNSYTNIDFDTYVAYIVQISQYFKIESFILKGIPAVAPVLTSLKDSFNDINQKYDMGMSIKWDPYGSNAKNCMNAIKNMLQNDTPVVFSYMNNNQLLQLYEFKDNAYVETISDYNIKSHYMVATGVIEYSDEIATVFGHKTMIKIATYGKVFYMDYEDYSKNLNFVTNIFEINKEDDISYER